LVVSQPSDFLTSLLGPTADPNRVLIVLIVGFVVAAILGELLRRAGTWVSRSLRRRRSSDDLDNMSGIEFEDFLAELFRRKGFTVEKTAVSGDYGVDLILTNPANHVRIAVQAKRYSQNVGIEAVQQVFFGAAYYGCQRALVITNADYTPNARNGAAKVGVWLIDGHELKAEIARVFGSPANQVA
jgi:restriction system protein